MDPVGVRGRGVQGFLRGSWLQRSNESKISTISRVLGFHGPRVNGSQGLIGSLGTQGPRASGSQGIAGSPCCPGLSKGLASP